MRKIFTLLAVILAIAGCKSGKVLLPNVSGKAGEVVIVMEKPDWEGNLGNDVRNLLAGDCPYLAQKEPLYSLVNVVPSKFTDLFQVHRNIVIFNINSSVDSAGILYRKDVWSQPQCVIQLSAPSPEKASALLKDKGPVIISTIEQAERDRVIRNTLLYEEKSIYPQVSATFGGSPHFPSGYALRKATSDFAWIANDYQNVYQDVLIYSYPADAEPFAIDKIIAHRNEVLKANVPGMFENTYMTTSRYFEPMIENLKYRGREFTQTRGMWEVQNDFMGGPFVSHSFYSRDGSKIIVAEAFVYAPRFDKRQYLRQVESILYSWEWSEKDGNNLSTPK